MPVTVKYNSSQSALSRLGLKKETVDTFSVSTNPWPIIASSHSFKLKVCMIFNSTSRSQLVDLQECDIYSRQIIEALCIHKNFCGGLCWRLFWRDLSNFA